MDNNQNNNGVTNVTPSNEYTNNNENITNQYNSGMNNPQQNFNQPQNNYQQPVQQQPMNNESPQNVKYCPKCGNKVDQSATTCFMC